MLPLARHVAAMRCTAGSLLYWLPYAPAVCCTDAARKQSLRLCTKSRLGLLCLSGIEAGKAALAMPVLPNSSSATSCK